MTQPARDPARVVERTYLVLTAVTTLAASFIWGVNTLFLLSAGLSNTEAFTANAFFTVGQVIFEIPTGVVADVRGRRFSFMLGSATLLVGTLLYLLMWEIQAPFIGWALASMLLGLGFTFFSGATEAWLVDALAATGHEGDLESVFGRALTVGGAAMLVGSVSGGFVAQATNLGVPYIIRAAILGLALVIAFFFMHDLGFTPKRGGASDRPGQVRGPRLDRRRLAQPAGPLADAGRAVRRRRRHLRVLRVPAVPPRAVRRSDRVRDRGPRGGDRGGGPDRRRAARLARPAAVQAPHRRRDPRIRS